ncbi:MAG TPA: glycoside hydrolase family 6 protein [Plantibacter sp.]|uniref:glycoside hydrolase family 6 protein n=1 Tax=unclassified Plantibacter TaxID=2624265 RepID=UPI002D186DD7|nr:glycoside hydrolase family 6 protein [Plantibacter sp.]
MPRTPRDRRRIRTAVALGIVAVLLAGGALVVSIVSRVPSASAGPFDGAQLYVDPTSLAARAAASDAVGAGADATNAPASSPTAGTSGGASADPTDSAEQIAAATRLAAEPTSIWLVPERYPLASVQETVSQIVRAAELQGSMPVFTVYGIPERDCGNQSAGGLSSADYQHWITQIVTAVADHRVAVVLEPDAVALAPDCGDRTARMRQLSAATAQFAEASIPVYLDGGHSAWRPAAEMAALLREAGVADATGFATNVSNYNATEDEIVYAEELSGLLDDAHYVIDTSRNGSGSNGEWCNPSGRTVGQQPLTVRAEHLDANLWVKAPGESDGACNGGPLAGVWWPEQAVQLAKGFSAW